TACGGAVNTTTGTTADGPAPSPTRTPSPTPTPTPSPVITGPNVSGCFSEDDGEIFTHGDDLPGVITGKGEVGVVITYERLGNVCNWRPLSDRLVQAGYRVLLYARDSSVTPEDMAVRMGKRLAGKKGVERLFFVGGSIGGTASAPAAARTGDKAAGIVALSGAIDPEDAADITVPLLQIGTEHDGYGGAEDLQAAHDAATKAPANEMHVIKGERFHATDLFRSSYGPEVLDRIVTFMDRHKG
ncbi:alpha/beta hydrolase, partial [Nonomuraea cavernae]